MKVLYIKKCLHCGKEFETYRESAKFCSQSCAGQYNSKTRKSNLPPQKCIVCGRMFAPWNKNQVTCGRKSCQRKHDAEQHKKKRGTYKYQKNEGLESPKPIKKKTISPASKRWASMSWKELTMELLYYRMSYPEAQLMAEKNTLPEDFGKKRKKAKKCVVL